MTPFHSSLSSWLRAAATVSCGLLSSTVMAIAEPVPLDVPFLPLEVELGQVCLPRPPVHQVVAQWSEWDGQSLGDRPTELVRRDLRILREADTAKWFDVIAAATALLRENDTGYLERDWLMDRIDLALAAGRPELLEQEDLVRRFLASGTEGSPGAQYRASQLLREGIGVPKDERRARELLIASAYGGNSEALLELASLSSDGTKNEGWDIDPNLAVTLAFGGLVGSVDDMICDRINRIASAYRLGEVVKQDVPLAERWYRLAANLGDFNAAWQVAQLHMRAEGIEKDNGVLLAHLEQAAQGGLPFAQAELGRVYEVGALAPRDLDRARALYEQAAAAGHYEGLFRLATLLRNLDNPTEADRARRWEVLQALTNRSEPPAWALVELGDLTLETKGRWAGETEAKSLYDRAIAISPDDIASTLRLAGLGFRNATNYEEFLRLTSGLEETVLANGSASSMDVLIEALTCRSPNAPHREHADYWRRMREMAGNISVTPPRAGESPEEITWLLARAQSQALVGRASSYAVLLELQDELGLSLDTQALRELSRDSETGPLTEVARLELEGGPTPQATQEALATLREAVVAGENRAREELLSALMLNGVDEAEESELRPLAEELAAEGQGLALEALVLVEGGGKEDREGVWTRYRDVIETNGDFEALLFAMPYLADEAALDDYADRARTVMPCNTLAALSMAESLHDLGRQGDVEHWLDVAQATGATGGWLVVAVADAYRDLSERPDALSIAVGLLNGAREQGNRTATLRLAALAQEDAEGFELPPEDLAGLFVDLIGVSAIEDVPNVLRRVRRADPEVQALVEAQVDVRSLYEQAAAAGSAVGQLELAKFVQAEASGQEDLAEYARLLTASAEQGQAEAMYLLSGAYSFGLGVQPSLETSRDWLFRAAEAGNQEALETVRLLETQGTTQ